MDKKHLFENEEAIYRSKDDYFTLTTHRVRTELVAGSTHNIVSIMLEKISSIEVTHKNTPSLLFAGIIAIVLAVGGGAIDEEFGEVSVFLTLIGTGFLIAFFLTRKSFLIISSDGGAKIFVSVKGEGYDNLVTVINKIEIAKNNRMLSISQKEIFV